MKSGPKELRAYHAQMLEQEGRHAKMRMRKAGAIPDAKESQAAGRQDALPLCSLFPQADPEGREEELMRNETLDPETLAEASARVNHTLHGTDSQVQAETLQVLGDNIKALGGTPPAPVRAPRSDKGSKRVPKPVSPAAVAAIAPAGGITEAEAQELLAVCDRWMKARMTAIEANAQADEAECERNAFIESLKRS